MILLHRFNSFSIARENLSVGTIRWRNGLESSAGHENPQPVPKVISGMITPDAFYCFGSFDSPGDPAKRPLQLVIYPLERQHSRYKGYDLNPITFLDTFRGDVARDLSFYIGSADHPGLAATKVIREGNHVTIDMGTNESFNRYTLDMNCGCNPVSCSGVSLGNDLRVALDVRTARRHLAAESLDQNRSPRRRPR